MEIITQLPITIVLLRITIALLPTMEVLLTIVLKKNLP